MSAPRHVCQGGTAAELVRKVAGENVLEILDDCAIGPLLDVDATSPHARVAFWTELFALDKEMQSMDWRAELCGINEALTDLSRETAEVVIWVGSHPTEQIMRRRVHWWLKDAPLLITEVLVDTQDEMTPIALVPPKRLRACFENRTPLTIEERKKLAAEWTILRKNGRGLRVWENGQLSEHQIDHYDADLLALIETESGSLLNVLGQAMVNTGRSDVFCKWRFATLAQAGKISLPHNN